MDDVEIPGHFTIPGRELVESFTTSGGPGGQHANRSATRVVLGWDIAASEVLDDELRERLRRRLGERMTGDEIRVMADDSRSQWRNRMLARRRLRALVVDALRPATRRRATRPSRAARATRLEDKRRRAAIKRSRKRPDLDD